MQPTETEEQILKELQKPILCIDNDFIYKWRSRFGVRSKNYRQKTLDEILSSYCAFRLHDGYQLVRQQL